MSDEREPRIAAAFHAIAEKRAAGGYAPVYARLAAGCATDLGTLALAAHARQGQNPPSLLLGAVQFLLADRPGHPLARFYPAITGHPAPDVAHDDPWPDFRSFVTEHHDAIAHIVATRLVRTQEVGRCAYLYPALLAVQRYAGAPLALIEIGPSAGLTLVPDRYAYNYATGRLYGDTTSPLVLSSEPRGDTIPPLDDTLDITWRAGIDLNPLRLADESDRAWLRALVWPDHPERAARLDTALTAASRGPLPDIHRGDVTDELPALLEQAPPDPVVCVYHTAVTVHFTDQARIAHAHRLRELSHRRRIIWMRAEPRRDDRPRLRFTDLIDGTAVTERPLGHYHPHGAWLHWLDHATSPTTFYHPEKR